MLEFNNEMGGIAAFILDRVKDVKPYYSNAPENYADPGVYFPVPHITTAGSTLAAYSFDYIWMIMFFDLNTEGAYKRAAYVAEEIRKNRNSIPIVDENGAATGESFRIKDPIVNKIDDGAVQLKILWSSARPYNSESGETVNDFVMNITEK